MKLSVARAIYKRAQTIPLIYIGKATGDQFGQQASVEFDGDNLGYYLQGSADGSKWWIAHFVYGGAYAEGTTKKQAALAFAKRLKWLPEKAKQRKLAEKIVAKYGIGPIIEQKDNGVWTATIDGNIVAKAATYQAAQTMAERFEKEHTK